ncbi:MAG: hypothetical protein ACPGUD_01860 [Parashewanella sp.]
MELPTTIYIALGAIFASLITGVFSFISLVNSKEQKVSEFRQVWIDELRNDSSKLIGILESISSAHQIAHIKEKEQEHNEKFDVQLYHHELIKDSLNDFGEVYHRIILRLNPIEHCELITLLNELRKHLNFNSELLSDKEILRAHVDTLISQLHGINQKEWKRVKNGESTYIVSKWAIGITVFLAILFSIHTYNSLHDVVHHYTPKKSS